MALKIKMQKWRNYKLMGNVLYQIKNYIFQNFNKFVILLKNIMQNLLSMLKSIKVMNYNFYNCKSFRERSKKEQEAQNKA